MTEIQELSDLHCFICTKLGTNPVILFGGVRASICTTHATSWHEYIVEEECYILAGDIKLRIDAALMANDPEHAIELHWEHMEQEKHGFGLGKEWLKEQRREWNDRSS